LRISKAGYRAVLNSSTLLMFQPANLTRARRRDAHLDRQFELEAIFAATT